jgi:hypothetical protein
MSKGGDQPLPCATGQAALPAGLRDVGDEDFHGVAPSSGSTSQSPSAARGSPVATTRPNAGRAPQTQRLVRLGWVEPFHEVLSNLFGRSDQRAVPKPMLDLSTDWKLVSASFAGSS